MSATQSLTTHNITKAILSVHYFTNTYLLQNLCLINKMFIGRITAIGNLQRYKRKQLQSTQHPSYLVSQHGSSIAQKPAIHTIPQQMICLGTWQIGHKAFKVLHQNLWIGRRGGTKNRTTKNLGHPILAVSCMQVKHNITIRSSQYSCSYVS